LVGKRLLPSKQAMAPFPWAWCVEPLGPGDKDLCQKAYAVSLGTYKNPGEGRLGEGRIGAARSMGMGKNRV
jgi:hypothetical protein